ncbi:MAG: sn-glycerol-3-phosphate ABC transporter permease UgpA [Desulfobacula sp.]|jgi:sn-glycerol 3-phosphate transport system permease protein|uniref:sn-glycerol-3-phosphate ABC transporter permease UgpA n=1 Tax=Desulfobacula sp. TaxID=2593537 RepID=UPI001DD2CB45|nr:sn-glycerol-3-phosphate ABC transporter permease UgpA [Desulfobacula sp.]MBT3485199.1 sn-glycerol-3-phosphate ABC transporter permease UgpA [Desulfobacula sp.]MBT3804795.1 sn-glycerol-3-phosphate ABC transporter permease UgpA [Desulfobacula sp.]MBT4025272.1 sn-glycerol-3-phosphate ABC transporter permease UgpA [Desulfobacula sp.]MBT4200144.1 sn-glycerol-3-phosphate ABC transporter permease UgpA [Desulfobacula sp.]
MIKRSFFKSKYLPYLLILPQMVVTLTFFYWPAVQGLFQSFLLSDPFGQKSTFVWFYNYIELFTDPLYLKSIFTTFVFSLAVAFVSLSMGLFIASMANRALQAKALIRTMLIWPYAVAPAISGILWLFLLHPSYGIVALGIKKWIGIDWNPVLYGSDAMVMIVMASAWKQISYNFVFFMAGMQAIPKSLIEAAAIDGASPFKRFWFISFPLLSPTFFFLTVMNIIYSFFETFGIIHTITQGGPGGSTNILVYKVYQDGFVGLNLGSSAAQSVVLMSLIIVITFLQFRFVEKKVQYGG